MAAEYRFNDGAGRFSDARTGRFVAAARVRAVVDSVADAASERMAAASARLLAGETSLAAWQADMAREIKLAHTSAAVLAHGGHEAMTPARWGAAGRTIRDEYAYLRQMAEQISDGRQALGPGLVARSRQYGQGARVQFERVRGRGQKERGFQTETNVLAPAEHCSGCLAQTARGMVPIGSLVPVGQRTCRAQCRCRIAYQREPARQQAAA